MNDKSRFTLLAIGPMLLIPIMVALISYVVINAEKNKLDNSLSRMEQDTVANLQLTMESKVNSMVDLITYRNSVIKAELHHRIHQRVSDAYKIANKIHKTYSPTKSESEVKAMIINVLRPLTWNQGESYIWIINFDGIFKLAPDYLRHLEGKSIIDFKDAAGREVIKEEIEISTKQGHGFIWDTFTKPGSASDEQFEQLAYVRSMGFYDWYMGSAEYLETATKASDNRLLAEISKFRKEHSDYFFIINTESKLLLNYARPELLGTYFSKSKNKALRDLFKQVQEAVKDPNGGVIDYQFYNPKVNKIERKIGFLRLVPGTNWIIGNGFHPADVHRGMAPKIAESSDANQIEIENMQLMAIWSFVISIVISILLSFFVYRLLWVYRKKVADKHRELSHLSNTFEEKVFDRTKDLEQVNDELEALARTDSLTGINNRFSFMKIIDEEVKRVHRFDETFSLVLFDIDNFKAINDRYGHDVGDMVLIEQAQVIKKHLREVDSFCRFGGEEFVIVLPKTDIKAAAQLAEKLRLEIEAHDFAEIGKLTISFGVGTYRQELSVKELIKEVDNALYKAKNMGRNRVCFADETLL